MGDLLRREGLSEPRRRPRYRVPLTQPLVAAQAPNDVWTADFKGWFRTADGMRCDPLTVVDACSRFVLCCRIVAPTDRGVRPWFERTFREYGLPGALRTDNGPPFATTAAAQLSPLAVWWLKLGIQLHVGIGSSSLGAFTVGIKSALPVVQEDHSGAFEEYVSQATLKRCEGQSTAFDHDVSSSTSGAFSPTCGPQEFRRPSWILLPFASSRRPIVSVAPRQCPVR
jgi:hypothetical protein